MAETWVLNETLTGNNYLSSNVSFTNNNTQYDIFTFAGNEKPKYLDYGKTDATTSIVAYGEDGWENQAYRTIIFDQPVTDTTLLTWLQSNGTKQGASSPTFKHFFNSGTIGSGTIKFRHFSQTEPLPQLATPQNVSVDGTTLSWDEVENATSYDIYADGTLIGNTDGGGDTITKQIDLSTLSGWSNLSDGEHTITIKAKADGYRDSQASEGVQVTKGSTGETWVLNETITTELQQTSVSFTSNGENFFGIRCADELGMQVGYFITSGLTSSKTVYSDGWTNTAYRTITFATAPTGDLLTWLQANGTKQGGGSN